MTCAWSGTVGDLKECWINGAFISDITLAFEKQFCKPTQAEIKSWEISIPEFLNSLSDPKYDPLQLVIELQMPVGSERADIVLLGGNTESPRAVVVELKQWSNFNVDPSTLEILIKGNEPHQHPCLQSLNYAGKLHFFNSRAHQYQIKSVAFLHNANQKDKLELERFTPVEWLQKAPIYVRSEFDQLSSYLEKSLLPCNLSKEEHILFSSAPYRQSNQLFNVLREQADNIAKDAALALTNSGMGLSIEQDRLKNEIFSSLNSELEFRQK